MATTENKTKPIENPLANVPNTVKWIKEMELGYKEGSVRSTVCFSCGSQPDSENSKKLSKCSRCGVAAYCSRECQLSDWKTGRHKMACPSYARVAQTPISDETKQAIRNELFARIRFYVCPYAVFRTAELGRGFLFLQSDRTLQDLSSYIPKDCTGRIITRSVLLHFLTLGEFDSEVCKDDFELALMRTPLKEAIETYETEKEVILLCRFRCGNMALGKAVLVPDYRICKQLAQDYYAGNTAGALQLNLDDM
mmetsp:Transcript_34078/g.80216  ORF Transcript_34078/g.80216 Transcript_34078/m.80216 type:complete len:252 (-) Transcript_34078:527-1282(-)